MRRVVKHLVLEGHGEVTELLPFVFLKDGHLTYDRFAFVSSSWISRLPYEQPNEDTWLAAIRLLESKVMTEDLLPGKRPEDSQIGLAALIAAAVHRNQQDKLGFPYLEHPRRVYLNSEFSLALEAFGENERMIGYQAAWLHDVLEDSEEFFYRQVTKADLSNWGFDFEVIATVMKLTKTKETSKDDYYSAIQADPVARAVKLADIADNMADWRRELLDDETGLILRDKYQHALQSLNYSNQRDNWLEPRLGFFDQGPLPLFAYPESKTALLRAEVKRTNRQDAEPRVPKDLYKKLEQVSNEVYAMMRSGPWRPDKIFSAEAEVSEGYTFDSLYAMYLALLVMAEGGRLQGHEPNEHEELGSILDSLNRSDASFNLQHLGVMPLETTSADMKLRVTRAVSILRKLRYNHDAWISGRATSSADLPSNEELIKAADLETVIDSAFLDFSAGLLPWGGKVFKELLSDIFYASQDY